MVGKRHGARLARELREELRISGPDLGLPEGISLAAWALEKITWQNPRIRAFLGCAKVLEGVLESNYAILNCSPERLEEIFAATRNVVEMIRNDIEPLMHEESVIPELEAARTATLSGLWMLNCTLFADLDACGESVAEADEPTLRKNLCVAVGKLQAFLQDGFGHLMAADPRSRHHADYYLSRQFPRDVEEAEWLQASVGRLENYLTKLEKTWRPVIGKVLSHLGAERRLLSIEQWVPLNDLLDEIDKGLTPRLRQVEALRGIRIDELEMLDGYALDLPVTVAVVREISELGANLVRSLETGPQSLASAGAQLESIAVRRMVKALMIIDDRIRDLVAFVPMWHQAIGQRRALMLKQIGIDSDLDPTPEP